MNLDVTYEIEDFSPDVLLDLSRRIEKSHTYEHLVYRESELDEVWRLLDFAVTGAQQGKASSVELSRLQQLRAGVIEAHDLIGVEGKVAAAAARMRDISRSARAIDASAGPLK